MDRETFTVKTEPEDDLKYILHYEEKFEIKSEIDIPIKSEENFKEEVLDYQEPECSAGPLTFPPIKEELPVMSFIIPPFSRPSRSSRLLLRPSRLSFRGPVPRSSSPS
uniref:Uncharacterized protein n=1 Tax=Timema genevievae TaxID=629358 RepID=A0A7R9PRD9_TIMGE|nr:unnamed protein product [Timema genevievae]